jgi:hypothetical protein
MIDNHFSTVFRALVVLVALAAPSNAAERTAVVSQAAQSYRPPGLAVLML